MVSILTAVTASAAGDEVFAYSHTAGDQWHLNVGVEEEVYIDGALVSRVEILNRIAVEVLEGNGGEGQIWNHYDIAERDAETGVYRWSSDLEVRYRRDVNGRLSGLPDNVPVPAVRDVPVFPDRPLSAGDEWTGEGRELFDLAPTFRIPTVITIPFSVRYTYVGPETIDGRDLELIEVEYDYRWQPNPSMESEGRLFQESWFPVEVEGAFIQSLWWDGRSGRNYAVDGTFSYIYVMNDGSEFSFRGTSAGKAVYAEAMDKEALVREIQDLERDDVRAEATDQGVKVSLDDINFVPDEAIMLPGQDEKLEGILEILSRYPDRDIQVIGHTARISGMGDGQDLSEERANTVARYIIDAGVRAEDRIITRGMGNRQPVGDNATEQGRRRNRRVEIVILEN